MRHTGRRWAAVALTGLLAAAVIEGTAVAQSCTRADFEAVVDDAAAALRVLNQQNRPAFQLKLRELKSKRGWSDDTFLKEAAPLVQDDRIAEFDARSAQYLGAINNPGPGASAAKPDCELLGRVRETMRALVETQTAKWGYMFERVERALAE